MHSSNMLQPNLIPLIAVTFSTPTFHNNVGSRGRVDFGGANQPKGSEERFSLEIHFFLSGEVQESLSLFWVSQAQAAMAWPAISTAQHSFDPSYG